MLAPGMTATVRWLGLGIVAMIGCRSNETRQPVPTARSTNSPRSPADAGYIDPCAGTSQGDICSDDRPVTTPLILPDGGIRLVFEDVTRGRDRGAHCRISDFTLSGATTVTAGCCERGHVVAAALDEADRFTVLCAEEPTVGEETVVARRMESDGTFQDASPVIDAGFPPPTDLHHIDVRRHHLLIGDRAMWVVYDVAEYDFKPIYKRTFIQRLRAGAKPISLGGARFAAGYNSNGAVFVATARDDGEWNAFHRVTEHEVIAIDDPKGTADARCDAWHGTALDPAGALELRFTQFLDGQVGVPVVLGLPGARPLPSATSRGSAIALCNGLDDGMAYSLRLDKLELKVVSGSEALSCGAGGCILVYVGISADGEYRFRVRRFTSGVLDAR